MSTHPRRPAGTPAGGQFAPGQNSDPEVALDDLTLNTEQTEMLMGLAAEKSRAAARKYQVDADDVAAETIAAVVQAHRNAPLRLRWDRRNDMAGYITRAAHNAAYRMAGKHRKRSAVESAIAETEERYGLSLSEEQREELASYTCERLSPLQLGAFEDPEEMAGAALTRVATPAEEAERVTAEEMMRPVDEATSPGAAKGERGRRIWATYSSIKGCAPAREGAISENRAAAVRRQVDAAGGVRALCGGWRRETLTDDEERALFAPFGNLGFEDQERLVFALMDLPKDHADAAWDSAVALATVQRAAVAA